MDSLPTVFHRALTAASRASNLPTIQDETQELINSAIKDVQSVRARVADLALFSPNEALEDISTRNLVYLFVPFVLADIQSRARATERDDRLAHSREAERYFSQFVEDLETYEVIPDSEREIYVKKAFQIADAARRRETKIKQYQKEKEIRSKIEGVNRRRRTGAALDSPTDFDLVAALLPSPSATSSEEEDEDPDTEDVLREATVLLLRLTYAQAHRQLESISQELELLRSAPPSVPQPPGGGMRDAESESWRLDAPRRNAPGSALLDPSGKPLQPFTILPSGAADRARLQSQVFQAGHRLPSMTIDEYLEVEQQRGNILTGGGPQSEAEPTSSEQLALDAEQDGTAFGEAKAEEKRQKDENWARYTDEHARGAGNTMNRG